MKKNKSEQSDSWMTGVDPQALLALILSSVSESVFVMNDTRKFLYVNLAMQKFSGIKTSLSGGTFADLNYPAELVEQLDQMVETVFQTGRVTGKEVFYTNAAGVNIHMDFTLSPMFGSDGHVSLITGVCRDTTEDHQLKASRDQLQSILDTTLLQLSILQAVRNESGQIWDLEIKIVNKELERETGRKDLVGKLYSQEYPGIRKTKIFELIVDTIETGKSNQMEYYYPYDGFDKWFSCMFVKLDDGVVATNKDITASRTADEKIRKMEAAQQLEIFQVTLASQEEERRRISESLHNGLGQLLYGIKISLTNITEHQAINKPEEYHKARNYTEQLLKDAIEESRRISHELMPSVLEDFGLKAAINDVCQRLNGEVKFYFIFRNRNVTLGKYIELAAFRTVQELILNVVKHSGAKIASVEVNVSKGRILIKVQDNGRGMLRLGASKMGIGLSSITSKVNLLNGGVKIDSAPGKGTTVIVNIPLPPA